MNIQKKIFPLVWFLKVAFAKKKKNTVRVTLGKCDENYYNLGGYSHVFPSKILFKAVMGMGEYRLTWFIQQFPTKRFSPCIFFLGFYSLINRNFLHCIDTFSYSSSFYTNLQTVLQFVYWFKSYWEFAITAPEVIDAYLLFNLRKRYWNSLTYKIQNRVARLGVELKDIT